MARIYNSRRLLDPTFVEIMRSNIDKPVDVTITGNRKIADSLVSAAKDVGGIIGDTAKSLSDEYKEKKAQEERRKLIGNPTDPMESYLADEYVRTGSTSGLLQYRNIKQMNENREAEKRYQDRAAENEKLRRYNIEMESVRPQYIKLQQDFMNADPEQKLVIRGQMNAIESKFPELKSSVNMDTIDSARQERIELEEAKKAEEEYLKQEKEEKEKEFKKRSLENRDYFVKNFIPEKMNDEDEKNEIQIMATNLYNRGGLTEEDFKFIQSKIQGEKSQVKQNIEAVGSAVAGKLGEQTGKDIEESRAKKQLADEGREAIKTGRRPTRAQQRAIDEGY